MFILILSSNLCSHVRYGELTYMEGFVSVSINNHWEGHLINWVFYNTITIHKYCVIPIQVLLHKHWIQQSYKITEFIQTCVPGYGTLPFVASSVSKTPNDQTSDLMVKRPYRAASGAVHFIGNLAPVCKNKEVYYRYEVSRHEVKGEQWESKQTCQLRTQSALEEKRQWERGRDTECWSCLAHPAWQCIRCPL